MFLVLVADNLAPASADAPVLTLGRESERWADTAVAAAASPRLGVLERSQWRIPASLSGVLIGNHTIDESRPLYTKIE